jgi:HPt (histidine-containing phosphotransfer) domain-containing protein
MEVPQNIMIKYIAHRKQDLEACLVSFEQGQFEELEKVGHQLKGNGATFGHPELSFLGNKLEIAAQVHNVEDLEVSLKEFSNWVNSLS